MHLYIELKSNEEWKDISKNLLSWLKNKHEINNFGVSEEDTLHDGASNIDLACLYIPLKYDKYNNKITKWAESTNRVYGILKGNEVILTNGEIITKPITNEIETPAWLK